MRNKLILVGTIALIVLMGIAFRPELPSSTLDPDPIPVPAIITHGPYTSKDAKKFATSLARTLSSHRSILSATEADENSLWIRSHFIRITGCNVIELSRYVGKGAVPQTKHEVHVMIHKFRTNHSPGSAIAYSRTKMDHSELAEVGSGRAIWVYSVVVVYCPTEEVSG